MLKLWTVKAYHGKRLVAIGYYLERSRARARSLMAVDMADVLRCRFRFTASPATDREMPIDAT